MPDDSRDRTPDSPASLDELLRLGQWLRADNPPHAANDAARYLAARLLEVRGRNGRMRSLIANRAQRAFERNRGRANIVLKARQMGLSTWIAGRYFLKTVTAPGVLTVQVAHTREAAESLFRIADRFWQHLPPAYRDGPLRRTRATGERMVFGRLDSEFRVVSAGEAAAGRGLTVQNLHLSEVSRWPGDASATLAGLRAALAPDGEITLESTPNGAAGAFFREWGEAEETGAVRHFFPWWFEESYTAAPATDLTEEEQLLAGREGLTPGQIGFRRALERGFRHLRAQEYAEDPETCFRSSGACAFPVDAIERRLHELAAPPPHATRRNGALEIYLPPVPGRRYLLGVDTAGGGPDGDFAAIQVLDRETGLQCAELRERLAPLELARVAAALAREYNRALLAVERNNHGAAVLAFLDAVERYPEVYGRDGAAGWLTTAGNKPAMVGRLGALLETDAALFHSRRLLAECRAFISTPRGTTEAAAGAHDDLVMSMAIAHAVRADRKEHGA